MVSINKSFLYGVGFASLTWIISLYLYLQLSTSNPANSKDFSPFSENLKNDLKELSNKAAKYKRKYSDKEYYDKNHNGVFNSKNFVDRLRPKVKNISKTDKLEEELFELGVVRDTKEQSIKDEGYKTHAYNVLISSKLSYHRDIPDTRNSLCKDINYTENLPSASVIICFHNEHNHTLLRTVHSILDRTPKSLLNEIILVDDYSDLENLHEQIVSYLEKNKLIKVRLFKTERREGLIRARIFGAERAKGKVLIFLDSHVEVNAGWIEPLLSLINERKTNVVMPVIDIINPDTFAYTSSPLVRGGFNWGLHFQWENLPKGTLSTPEDFIKPIKSPTMAGGLFAISRKYFIDIGEYDAGMNIWGGENLEISFRIWMCGGSLELLPCSRVGHIFRHRRPYGSPDGEDTMLRNSLRVANVWMDDYKQYFYNQNKHAKGVDYGDVSSRIQLRTELKCHDFNWYLKNIYPELILPSDDKERTKKKLSAVERNKFQPWHSVVRNYIDEFQIRLKNSSLCIQSSKDVKTKGSFLVLRPCVRNKSQRWYQTDKNELVLAQLLCLQASTPNPILYKCHELGADQEWKHKDGINSPIYNLGAGTCLAVNKKKVNAVLEMKLCSDPELSTWDFINM